MAYLAIYFYRYVSAMVYTKDIKAPWVIGIKGVRIFMLFCYEVEDRLFLISLYSLSFAFMWFGPSPWYLILQIVHIRLLSVICGFA